MGIIGGRSNHLFTYGNIYSVHNPITVDFDFGPGIDTLRTSRAISFIHKIGLGSLDQPELKASPKLHLYPNPTDKDFQILCEVEIEKVCLFNQSGKAIKEFDLSSESQMRFTIDGPPGLYLVKIQLKDGWEIWRKVIKR